MNILLTTELRNLYSISKNLEVEVQQLRSQVKGLTLERDIEQAERISPGATFEEVERKLEATNDRISIM